MRGNSNARNDIDGSPAPVSRVPVSSGGDAVSRAPAGRHTGGFFNERLRHFIGAPRPSREWLQCWDRIDAGWKKERNFQYE